MTIKFMIKKDDHRPVKVKKVIFNLILYNYDFNKNTENFSM